MFRLLLVLVVCTSACSESQSPGLRRGRVEIAPDIVFAHGQVAVVSGKAWTLPGADNYHPIEDGRFEVDSNQDAVSAFIDVDGNGEFDPTSEPSYPCVFSNGWLCKVRSTTIQLHSRRREKEGVWQRAVFASGFQLNARGSVNPDFSFCTENGQCAAHDGNAFANSLSSAATLTLCDWTEDPDQPPLSLKWDELGAAHQTTLTAAATPTVRYSVRRDQGNLRIEVNAEGTIDRALVWVGQLDENGIRAIVWHSELSEKTHLSPANGTFSTSIPVSALTTNARVVLQVAKLDQTDHDGFWRVASTELILRAEELR